MKKTPPDTVRELDSAVTAAVSARDRAAGIVAFATILALLYFGRDVLIPFTVAIMLSLLAAPLVRIARRLGLGHASSVLAAVTLLVLILSATAAILGAQVLRMAESLPRYERTIHLKMLTLDEMTVGRVGLLTREARGFFENALPYERYNAPASAARPEASAAAAPLPVVVRAAPTGPFQIVARVMTSIGPPIETAGIILIVLIFVLLEREALRDRVIRMAGTTNIRLTTLALNDAGERLSRYFVSQFTVNFALGVAIALGLAVLGVPQAILWGALATGLRFVPYLGIWIAAVLATMLSLAVVPGWWLAFATMGLFILVEVVVSQAVEPHLYGHRTGLSPLSVIVAAIFWSALWGPIGLVLSVPLTVCLLVAGRHIRALGFLELVLGDTQALTLPQKFYQRALSSDADEIVAVARAFLKRNSFAAYCDRVLVPAMHLAALDYDARAISQEQLARIRKVVVAVISELAGERPGRFRAGRGTSVLEEASPGKLLRQQRERVSGQSQGPAAVPPGSMVLCLGIESGVDVLAAELLVRALREQKVDARHLSQEDIVPGSPPLGADPAGVAAVCLVSAFPNSERERSRPLIERIRQLLPGAPIVAVLLPGMSFDSQAVMHLDNTDEVASSFVEAVQICLEHQKGPQTRPPHAASA